jgi:hypothetical protein
MKIFNVKSKKASLSLSLEAIVIVVLAMTILSLGLPFIKQIFSGATSFAEEAFSAAEEELQKKLGAGETFAFSSEQFNVEAGNDYFEGFGIRNKKSSTLYYGIAIETPVSCPQQRFEIPQACTDISNWFDYIPGPTAYKLEPAQEDFKKMAVSVESNANAGRYIFRVVAYTCTAGGTDVPALYANIGTGQSPCPTGSAFEIYDVAEVFMRVS